MIKIQNVSRRTFLKGVAVAGSLVLEMSIVPRRLWGMEEEPFSPSVYLAIASDGSVTIVAHRSEAGSGIRTSLPMILADELEADWSRVKIVQGVGDPKYGHQATDGSRSVRMFYQVMREAGAAARQMLEQAAAERWGVDFGECRALNHAIVHAASGRTLGFGEVAGDASRLPVPPASELSFKTPDRYRYVGKRIPITDLDDSVTGRAKYGLDIRLEGMKYASIERCPVLGGSVLSFDDSETLAVPGVERVVEIPKYQGAPSFKPLGGVAVVADSTWAALEGRRKLKIDWDSGSNESFDSAEFQGAMGETARRPGQVVREVGSVDEAMASAVQVLEADYATPFLAHASMEPPCATARVEGDRCEVWAPTQVPQITRQILGIALALDPANITVNVTLLGSAFGRKAQPDYVVEAAILSKEAGSPVQLVWTREDDVRHDYYNACGAMHFRAGVDADGRPLAWLQRTVFPSISSTFRPGITRPDPTELEQGFTDIPYDLPNLRCENGETPSYMRIGWLRSVCNIFHAFGVNCFADELAARAGRDRLEYLFELIGPPRHIDPNRQGAEYANYGESLERHPIDTGRLASVLRRAAEEAGWGRELPRGSGMGLAVHRSFACFVAAVIEVSVSRTGKISVPRLDIAVDSGIIVNPDRVMAQMEGAGVFGVGLAKYWEISTRNGAVEQGNFDDYEVARMSDGPREVHGHLVDSDAPPGGIGEPGVPPIAPALCNAIFAATGRRVRTLPLIRHDLSWG